jgi:hypothetical protein
MNSLVRAVLKAGGVCSVIVSNNNPKHRILQWVRVADPSLELIDQPVRAGCSKRFEIARERGTGLFLCIDDDVFLTPPQITELLRRAAARPDVPHGVHGSEYGINQVARPETIPHIIGRNACVDLIHTVYAFTGNHVRRFFELLAAAEEAGLKHLDVCDDIILSHSGEGRPEIHDIGRYRSDPTWNSDTIAVFRQPDYIQARAEAMVFFRRLFPPSRPLSVHLRSGVAGPRTTP